MFKRFSNAGVYSYCKHLCLQGQVYQHSTQLKSVIIYVRAFECASGAWRKPNLQPTAQQLLGQYYQSWWLGPSMLCLLLHASMFCNKILYFFFHQKCENGFEVLSLIGFLDLLVTDVIGMFDWMRRQRGHSWGSGAKGRGWAGWVSELSRRLASHKRQYFVKSLHKGQQHQQRPVTNCFSCLIYKHLIVH